MTSSVAEMLAQLRALDVQVTLDGDRLRLNAPPGALTDEHRADLKQRKDEIVQFLRTVQQLAGQQRAIVPLQAGGWHTPVFAVAGHAGDVFCYRSLAAHLGADQPFFGLRPPGLDDGAEPLSDVAALADYFASQIRAFRPAGPYVIAGFCAGGTVAFELARQFVQAGQDVTRLVMFGAPYCTAYRKIPQLIATGSLYARRSLVHARALVTMPSAERRDYFAARVRSVQQTLEVPQSSTLVEEATMEAVRRYDPPQPFDGHMDLMLPCLSWTKSADAPLRWAQHAASCTQYAGPEDCNGDTMLLPEHAATFAALFEQARQIEPARSRA